jgi:hypothetical protein
LSGVAASMGVSAGGFGTFITLTPGGGAGMVMVRPCGSTNEIVAFSGMLALFFMVGLITEVQLVFNEFKIVALSGN